VVDIVNRLRKEIAKRERPYPVELLPELQEAADEIERIRAELVSKADELAATLRQLRKVETECSMLRVECGILERNAETTYENHKRIVAELTAERDEARRCLCECLANGVSDATLGEWFNDDGRHLLARDIATERGWDCFHA